MRSGRGGGLGDVTGRLAITAPAPRARSSSNGSNDPLAMIVWILSHAHGSQRLRIPSDDGTASARRDLQLPRQVWLEHRLSSAGVDCEWSGRQARPSCFLCGLAVLRPTIIYEGCATKLSAEARTLHQYYMKATDTVVLQVAQIARLVAGVSCRHFSGAGFAKPDWVRRMVSPDCLAALEAVSSAGPPHRPQGEPRRVQEILQDWGHAGAVEVPPTSHPPANFLIRIVPGLLL